MERVVPLEEAPARSSFFPPGWGGVGPGALAGLALAAREPLGRPLALPEGARALIWQEYEEFGGMGGGGEGIECGKEVFIPAGAGRRFGNVERVAQSRPQSWA